MRIASANIVLGSRFDPPDQEIRLLLAVAAEVGRPTGRRRDAAFYGTEIASLAAFLNAYNFTRWLKTQRGLTPYEAICKAWMDEPHRFRLNPVHLASGLNT